MPKTVVGVLRLAGGGTISGRNASSYNDIEIAPVSGGPHLTWDGFGMASDIQDELTVGAVHTFYYSPLWRTVYAVRVEGRPGRFSCSSAKPTTMLMYAAFALGALPVGAIVTFFLGLGGVLVGIAMVSVGFLGLLLSLDAVIARGMFNRDENHWRRHQLSQRPT